jgi:agmatinase
MTQFSPTVALEQLERAYGTLLGRHIATPIDPSLQSISLDGKHHPRLVTFGGDHTIILPILRNLKEVYGPITQVPFSTQKVLGLAS